MSSSLRPPIIEKLRAEMRGEKYRPAKRVKEPPPPPDPHDIRRLLTICTGNRWMELGRRQPEAKMLFGELWHQDELCILFADTNAGKSVLAVQIADSLSRGQPIAPFACQAPPARVLYVDFELSTGQFCQRYTHAGADYVFADHFFRAQFNSITDIPGLLNSYDDLLIAAIEEKLQLAKATVLVIDNITALRGGTENASVTLKLMQRLKSLKANHHLSILVLAHTPKRRNSSQPLSADDLHGSKLLINFADSAFAIGKSNTGGGLCYLKQIKQRNTGQLYGPDNVCLCSIQKPGEFLHFRFEGNSPEHLHLQPASPHRTNAGREQLILEAARLSAEGLSQRQISQQLKISLGTVNTLIRRAGG